ncbi:ROK family protein [Bacillus rubiinfantis]|uniref:ROK family protein n=1 Tax=Bacillus rubiinfantis TaxID=1499680 RepID=UPI0005A640CB|nr:ROK family protein [Bacillus rubiinfantis]
MKAIGIDIGGTKIAAGIITDTGKLLHSVKVKSDRTNREKMFARVVAAVEQLLDESQLSIADMAGIGVGVPGKVDCDKGIAVFQNNLPWQQFPLQARLQEQFQPKQITLDNDVYMAAFAEANAAKASNEETFVYVTISTGISCCIIHKGEFFRGAGFAGELGLIPVLAHGENKRLETVAAGPAIEQIAKQKLADDALTAAAVFARYQHGVREGNIIIDTAAAQLAQGLYSLSCLMDPHRIVFGGSVIVHNPFFLDLVKEKLANYVLPEQRHLLANMTISGLAQDNGVIGAGLRVLSASM